MNKQSGFWVRKIKQTSINNRLKNEAKMGIALGIYFSWIFIDFGRQVGAKLASQINLKLDPNRHQIHVAKKLHLEASWKPLGVVLASWGERSSEAAGSLWDP